WGRGNRSFVLRTGGARAGSVCPPWTPLVSRRRPSRGRPPNHRSGAIPQCSLTPRPPVPRLPPPSRPPPAGGTTTPLTPPPSSPAWPRRGTKRAAVRSEEHTSELQSRENLVCRLLLDKKKTE